MSESSITVNLWSLDKWHKKHFNSSFGGLALFLWIYQDLENLSRRPQSTWTEEASSTSRATSSRKPSNCLCLAYYLNPHRPSWMKRLHPTQHVSWTHHDLDDWGRLLSFSRSCFSPKRIGLVCGFLEHNESFRTSRLLETQQVPFPLVYLWINLPLSNECGCTDDWFSVVLTDCSSTFSVKMNEKNQIEPEEAERCRSNMAYHFPLVQGGEFNESIHVLPWCYSRKAPLQDATLKAKS